MGRFGTSLDMIRMEKGALKEDSKVLCWLPG